MPPRIEEATLGLYQFPLNGEAEFIICVRRVRVDLYLKHGLAVLVAVSCAGIRPPAVLMRADGKPSHRADRIVAPRTSTV